MKKNVFLVACLSLGLGLSGNLIAQSALSTNDGAKLVVHNDAHLVVRGDANSKGNMTMKETSSTDLYGGLEVPANGKFNMLSTAAGKTASVIAHNEGTSTINASNKGISSQRFIGNDSKWHYFTAPVNGQAIDDQWVDDNRLAYWNDGTAGHVDFWRWNETESKWKPYQDNNSGGFADGTSAFVSGAGFITAVKTDGQKANLGVLAFDGSSFNNDNVGVPVTATGTNEDPNHCWQAWNLVGNPFTSAYQIAGTDGWLNDQTTKDALGEPNQAVYVFVEGSGSGQTVGSNFLSVTDYKIISNNGFDAVFNYNDENGTTIISGATFSALGQNYIAPGQAFFVRVRDGVSTLNFAADKRAHKFEADATFYKGGKEEQNESWPGFMLIANNGRRELTGTLVSFDEAMTPALDPSCDVMALEVNGQNMFNKNISVYTQMVEGDFTHKMAQQALPWNTAKSYSPSGLAAYEIPVGVDVTSTSNVTFDIFQRHLDNESIVLEDRKMGVFTDLNQETYATTVEQGENGYGRFFMHVGEKADEIATGEAQGLQLTAYMVDKNHLKVLNPAFVVGDYQIYDMNGKALSSGRLTGNGEQVLDVDLAMGMYILKVYTNYKAQSFKFINK